MKGITAIAALTILTLPTWASEKGGQGAKPGTSHCDCPSHAITLNKEANNSDRRDRTRSAKPGGTLSPLDLLVLHNEQDAKKQGQGWGAMVGQGAQPVRLTDYPWPSIQRDRRVPRRDLIFPPSFLGNEVWIRTTKYPRGLRKVTVRNSFGQPLNWRMEEDTRFIRGLLAAD